MHRPGKVRGRVPDNDGFQLMERMLQFLAVVVVCTIIGTVCEHYDINRYLKWLLMALPAIVWVRLRNPFQP
jgi:uncharacterized membrane protein YbjE (DUF340 family)